MAPGDNNHHYRRGACPGAGSAMATGDGLLTRMRLPGGRLSAQHLQLITALADRWGQSFLELTSRGNIQIRGLSPDGDAEVTQALRDNLLAATPAAAESTRNVLSTPAADIDTSALADPWPIAQALERALLADSALWALPGKFRFVIDGGGATTLASQSADIRADAVSTPHGTVYRLALAGTATSAHALGECPSEQVAAKLLALAHCALELNARLVTPAFNIGGLIAKTGLSPFEHACAPLTPPSPPCTQHRFGIVGAQPGWIGAAVPLGQLATEAAYELAELALREGNGELRFTPWRQVLLPQAKADIAPVLQQLGLITAEGDPRLSLTACPGAPACQSGTTATRSDGLAWAKALPELFDGELAVHISGCPKGCARPQASPLTLTARDGHYDLIINDQADPLREANHLIRNLATTAVLPALRRLSDELLRRRRTGEKLEQVLARMSAERARPRDQPFDSL